MWLPFWVAKLMLYWSWLEFFPHKSYVLKTKASDQCQTSFGTSFQKTTVTVTCIQVSLQKSAAIMFIFMFFFNQNWRIGKMILHHFHMNVFYKCYQVTRKTIICATFGSLYYQKDLIWFFSPQDACRATKLEAVMDNRKCLYLANPATTLASVFRRPYKNSLFIQL